MLNNCGNKSHFVNLILLDLERILKNFKIRHRIQILAIKASINKTDNNLLNVLKTEKVSLSFNLKHTIIKEHFFSWTDSACSHKSLIWQFHNSVLICYIASYSVTLAFHVIEFSPMNNKISFKPLNCNFSTAKMWNQKTLKCNFFGQLLISF